jgi:hypothetical protein
MTSALITILGDLLRAPTPLKPGDQLISDDSGAIIRQKRIQLLSDYCECRRLT